MSFVCCVEAGRLEDQAKLLVRSIRHLAGTLADAPIYAVAPRAGREPSESTISTLESQGATVVVQQLNDDYPDYGMANKWAATRWVEDNGTADIIAFVDSDTFFAADPVAFRLPSEISVAVRPADRKDKGSTGPGDEREAYWERLYGLTGVSQRPWVETPADHQRIRGYFNGGLVVARRTERFFSAWYDDFRTLERAGHLPPEGIDYMDMLSLAATVARCWERVRVLDWRYNYPLPHRPSMSEPARSAALEDMVHVHYHRYFARPGFLDAVFPPLPVSSPVRTHLEQSLPLQPTIKVLPPAYRRARLAAREARAAQMRPEGRLRRYARGLVCRCRR